MGGLGLESASLALGQLEATPKYRALAASGTSRRFSSFRQRVEIIRAGCRAAAPAAAAIEELQAQRKALRADCRGP
jgi:predicted nucleic acid-binding Zn ribbon protein